MTPRFKKYLKVVAAAHLAVLAIFFALTSGLSLLRPKEETVMPVEFVVEVPPAELPHVEIDAPAPVPDRAEPPEPPEPDAAAAPPQRKEIVRSTKKVHRRLDEPPPKTLSDEEIRKLLMQGAKPGDHTSIPDEDTRCFEIVRQTLYQAWHQPAEAEAKGRTAQAAIRLDSGGRVTSRQLVKGSGSGAVDQSVLIALEAVKQIPGLTPSFLARHEEITVAFKVE